MWILKTIFKTLLLPLAGIYLAITSIRNRLYDWKVLKTHSFNVPVISVGNITAGGTGKSPFVIVLAKILIDAGYLPGIVTRGYKRRSRGQQIVRDRASLQSTALLAGDEPFLIASNVDGAVVISDSDRVAAAQTAVEKFGCDVIIADDAFQHRRLKRDVDIVLWDAHDHPNRSCLLPFGRLRESMRHLRRADLLLVTRTDSVSPDRIAFFRRINPGLFIAPLPMTVTRIVSMKTDRESEKSELWEKRVLAFCGLGNPRQFFNTIKNLTAVNPITRAFADHYKYSAKDIEDLKQQADEKECRYLVTTRKDAVNFPQSARIPDNLLIVDIEYFLSKKIRAAIFHKLPPRN